MGTIKKTGSIKTKIDAEDFVRGCVFMGTGGGGPQETGLRYLLEDLEDNMEPTWVDPKSIPDDAWTCVAYFMGSIAPFVPETKMKMEAKGLTEVTVDRELVKAVKELQKYLGIEFAAVCPMELGGINTPAPLDAATRLGIAMVDGDYSGRALPEIVQVAPAYNGFHVEPVASCDRWGNTIIIKDVVNNTMLETFGKGVTVLAYVICGQCGLAMKGKDMKKFINSGSLTMCLEIGRTIREAREAGLDPVAAVLEACEGWELFRGEVVSKDWEDREGYLYGTTVIKGSDKYKGHELKIWYKNENHMSWLDGEVYVTSPDLISVVDALTCEPITNTDVNPGMKVAVIGMKSKYRSPKAIDVLGPKHYGFDVEYRPIEEIVK
jgi:DUF917 family protein